MIRCYDSLGTAFICQLEKIKCLYARKVFTRYKQERYGIADCRLHPDLGTLSDLLSLMEYHQLLDLSSFSSNTYRNLLEEGCLENDCCDFSLETLEVCNISPLLEKINSL